MYSLDTNVFMDWQARYYPMDVFVGLRTRIESLIAVGELAAVELVREEIDAVGTPDLRKWSASQAGLFVAMAKDVQREGAAIEASYPELTDPKSLHESADAYVIALAKLRGGVVVSQETSVHEKHRPRRTYYVPDVCRDLGIPCITILGLIRREKWSF